MNVVEHHVTPAARAPALVSAPERAARGDLRAQIGRIERELAQLAAATFPRLPRSAASGVRGGPRVLGLGELERVRDALARRLTLERAAAAAQGARQADARALLERMYVDPPAHRRVRLVNADLGLPGCTAYEVVPRAGVVGMLAGWWHVKVSSGCPLGWGP
jgi:hypothetical protein